jgi:predicted ester cyclase
MTSGTPAAEHEAACRRLIAAVGSGREDVVDDLLGPDLVDHDPVPGQPPGPDGFTLWMREAPSAFPDLVGIVEDVVTGSQRVAGRVRYRGTHEGDFLGVPATGRPVAFEAFHILRSRGREIVEWWGAADLRGARQQIGAGITPPMDG